MATSAGSVSSVSRPVPPCGYDPWMSGAEMAGYVAGFVVPMFPAPPAGWEAYVTDTTGLWYRSACHFTARDLGTADALERRNNTFVQSHPPIWSTGQPPAPPISVEDLITMAKGDLDNGQIPSPLVALNPLGSTVTGLPTWVWPTGVSVSPVTARAESGPNWAQVTAVPGGLRLSAADAQVGPCTRPVVWHQGAAEDGTDCYVTFRRSSARTGTVPLTVGVSWRVTLTTSDGRNEVLDDSYSTGSTVRVAVGEVQSVLK